MSFPNYCPPALQKNQPSALLVVKAEKPVDKIRPVVIVNAGKSVDKNARWKERAEAAEKLVDEITTKERRYKKAAKDALKDLRRIRKSLNATIATLRKRVTGKEPIVIEDDPITIEDDSESEVDLNEDLFADKEVDENQNKKEVDKNQAENKVDKMDEDEDEDEDDLAEEIFGGNKDRRFEEMKKDLQFMRSTIHTEQVLSEDPYRRFCFKDILEKYDDICTKIELYMEKGKPTSSFDMDCYFLASDPKWLGKSYGSFEDVMADFMEEWNKVADEYHRSEFKEIGRDDDLDDFCPPQTQV